jgi:hypothetical protein
VAGYVRRRPGVPGEVAQAAKLKDNGQDIDVESGREFFDLLPGWESAPHGDAGLG